ncbi:MAG: hypothetical protein DRH37_01210 [Deltaproteobacteria bacterium]|nr:MAG: hypothetical protein DRH37_01210 [Deltaproteobacteria bacterium]
MNILFKGLEIDVTITPGDVTDVTSFALLSDPKASVELEINSIKIADEDELISCLSDSDSIYDELFSISINHIKERIKENKYENKRSFL